MFDGGGGGGNCGKGDKLWQPYMVRGTIAIGGAVFGPAGPLAARTTCGVTASSLNVACRS